MSDAFVANVRPNVIFLDESSRLALDKPPSRAIRSFAHGEARQQTIAANSLTAWTQTYTRRGEAVALGAPVIGVPVIGAPAATAVDLAYLPVGIAAGVTDGVGGVVTGRSVAIDTPLTVTPVPVYGLPGYVAPGTTVGSQILPPAKRHGSFADDEWSQLRSALRVDSARWPAPTRDAVSRLLAEWRRSRACARSPLPSCRK